MSINFHDISQARDLIANTARKMLDGTCSYIEGTRLIWGLLSDAKLDSFEEPFVAFVAIGSQTEAVPIGAVRARWNPDAQIKLAEEWANAEAYAKRECEPACRDVIVWLACHPFKDG